MNNEELKKKAEEYFAGKGYVEDSERQWWDSAHIVSFETELKEAFLAGHQLALDGASADCDYWPWFQTYDRARFMGSLETAARDGYGAAWQARGLLAAKREGELLAEIERIKEISQRNYDRAEAINMKRTKLRMALTQIRDSGDDWHRFATDALAADDKAQGGGV